MLLCMKDSVSINIDIYQINSQMIRKSFILVKLKTHKGLYNRVIVTFLLIEEHN